MAHFSTTVPKELVHRAAVAEVLLTRWLRLDDTHFSASAQWPRGHSFFTSPDGLHHDPVLTAETIRQVGTLLAHAEFGVPMGNYFVLESLHFSVDLPGLELRNSPADLELAVSCHDIRRSGSQVSGIRYVVEFFRDGIRVATGGVRASFLKPTVYHRIRGGRLPGQPTTAALPEPVDPSLVGRRDEADVVLAPTEEPRRWLVRADTRHPILFDHPCDHVPGMVLLEAARQAALIMAPGATTLTAAQSSYSRYVEFDAPCSIEAREEHTADPTSRQFLIRAEQNGRTVFTTTLSTPA